MLENLRNPDCMMSNILFLTAVIFAILVFIFVFLASRHSFIAVRILKALFFAALTCIGGYLVLEFVFFVLRIYVLIIFAILGVFGAFFSSLDN